LIDTPKPSAEAEAMTMPDSVADRVSPSLARRMACWLYEGMLLFGVVFISGYLFGTLSQTKNALHNRHGLQAFLFLVFAIYFTWFWSKGQTLAMKTWHIQVLDKSGQRLTQARAFWRYLLSWLWVLPPLLITAPLDLPATEVSFLVLGWVMIWAVLSRFQSRGQYWHDIWAGTQLVDVQQSPSNSTPPPTVHEHQQR
jgi:uncharacterized RDD family membrane protein YckC